MPQNVVAKTKYESYLIYFDFSKSTLLCLKQSRLKYDFSLLTDSVIRR